MAIIAVIAGTLVMVMYQIFNVTDRGSSELAVQHDLRNAAVWLNRDVLSASEAEVIGSRMVLTIPTFITTTINITYTYSEAGGTLTRESDDSSLIIARHVYSDPFPSLPDPIDADDTGVVTVTLRSREGNVPGSGEFALKMRAGGFIRVEGLCQIVGDLHLTISPFPLNTVQWNITNSGGDTASIEQIIIEEWPHESNGALTEIWLVGGTSSIFAESREDPPATIIKPSWGTGERTIDGVTQQTLEFLFEADAVNDEDLYSIEITFGNGCIISFP